MLTEDKFGLGKKHFNENNVKILNLLKERIESIKETRNWPTSDAQKSR